MPYYAVLGCLVGAFLMVLGSPVWTQPPDREGLSINEPALEDAEPEPPAQQEDEPETTLPPSPVVSEEEQARAEQRQREEAARHDADLEAQRRMAAASEDLLASSNEQNDLVWWNNILLAITVAFTALAAGAAAMAAGAARSSVAVADKTAMRQLRAYVTITDVEILFVGDEYSPNVRIVYKNSGVTPAYRVRNIAECRIGEADRTNFSTATQPHKRRFDLGPGQDAATIILVSLAGWNVARDEIASGKKAVFAFGEIEYRDAFDALHFTRYRFRTRFDADGIKDSSLIPCDEGNESD